MTTATTAPLAITPSQTIGPFSHEAWRWAASAGSAIPAGPDCVTIGGILFDGAGKPVDDGQIEFWSPGAAQAEQHCALPGLRRCATDADGRFVATLPRPAPGEPAAYVTVFARGLLLHMFTAVFLPDDTRLAQSALLSQVPAERAPTLLAAGVSARAYQWDIRLQGEHETVFFDYA